MRDDDHACTLAADAGSMLRQHPVPYYPIGYAAIQIGVSTQTLRRWAKQGRIRSSRSAAGHHLFDLWGYLHGPTGLGARTP
jgi:hypothetical protein